MTDDGLRPYPEYRESGLAWLGTVPQQWQVLRGKNVFRPIDVRSVTGDEELLTVSSAHGVVRRSHASVTMFKAESYIGHKLCWPGDLVVNSLWAWMQGLGFSDYHGLVSSAYSVYRPHPEFAGYARYLHLLLRSSGYKWELLTRSKGVWLSRLQLSNAAFLDMPLVIPPAVEQSAIVRYLDDADRRIRRYVRAKQRLIALLEEQKRVIVHRAVTRGLDPDVPLKPSGVDWLGDVPAHWKVGQLRRFWDVIDCKHLTVPFTDEGVPLASVREVQQFDLELRSAKRTSTSWYEQLIAGGRRPRRGDVIFCRNVSVGAAAYVGGDDPVAMGQDVCLLRSQSQNGRFLNYALHSQIAGVQLQALMVGSTFDRVNVSEVKSLIVAVPPRAEQDTIAAALDAQFADTSSTAAQIAREITLLREYRTRLVADVVTGKLDVRAAAARVSDEADLPGAALFDENGPTDDVDEQAIDLEPAEA